MSVRVYELDLLNLETTIRYRRELKAGDEVDVSCRWTWGEGKTYRVQHVLRRPNGDVAAEVTHVSGLLDLRTRRLLPDPKDELRRRAARSTVLGIPAR